MRRVCAGVAMLLAAACTPAPSLSVEEARRILDDVGAGRADAIDICTDEGRAAYRAAVRAYSRAQHEQGLRWPNVSGPLSDEFATDPAQLMAVGALIVGIVEPSDLSGDARGVFQTMAIPLALSSGARTVRRGLRAACPDVLALQRMVAADQIEMERLRKQGERAREQGDTERFAQIAERAQRRSERSQRQMAILLARIEARLEETQN